MLGTITELYLSDPQKGRHGVINAKDKNSYYFNQDSLISKSRMDDFSIGDEVSFVITPNCDKVIHMKLEKHVEEHNLTEFAAPGLSRRLDLSRAAEDHLKPNSGELEVIQKLKQVLRITRIGHHYMDQSSLYQFCLASVTETFKQYVRESGEFLIVFSHFDDKSWQQKTLKVERELRKRRDLIERRPLVNFYILISNASELRAKVDSIKGEPRASVIPFSFEELLACKNTKELTDSMLNRFGEYYFENNMLGENDAIDDDNLLFGDRGKIADAVVARIHQGSNSGIFGLRRSGKTSVLNAVLRRLDREETPYVLVESRTYETFSSWKNVLFEIACQVRARMLETTRCDDESLSQFHDRLNLTSNDDDYEKRGVACFIDDIRRYRGDKLFVIALDEIELITYNTATSETWKSLDAYKGFWSALRGCACPIVVCGVNSTINEVSNLTFNGEQCDNPMYGRIMNCSESGNTYLPAFTDDQTKEMINTLGKYSNIAFSYVYGRINNAFGGQPWAIRQFCSYIFDNVKSQRESTHVFEVSKATCDNLMRQFQTSSAGVHLCETILQHLSIYRSEYSLLKKMALSPEKYNSVSGDDIISIDHLQKYGLIEHDIHTGHISFRIGIIRDHICKTETKSPEDMDNNERRRYIQDCIAVCEKKLKQYILNYYTYASTPEIGRALFFDTHGKCILKPHVGILPSSCIFPDFFDHKKFDFYFSKLKILISENWPQLGLRFTSINISKEKFISCMEDLNAGRTDADHYDPENTITSPENWEIDDQTMQAFRTAYNTMNRFFKFCGL